jgi:hypothetical protein
VTLVGDGSINANFLNMKSWRGEKLNGSMNAGVVEEVKSVLLNDVFSLVGVLLDDFTLRNGRLK